MTASGLSDAELSSQYFVIFDLVTNWVYGDIGYDEFFSSDEETDSERADLGQQLAELSEEEQLNALTHIVRHYHDTCEVHIK
ncbi:MAG: hypothetical protein GX037_04205 [Trueperella sp.]|nr:hypothetical protein [Trueperella sp.]